MTNILKKDSSKLLKWILLIFIGLLFFFSLMFYDVTISYNSGYNLFNAIIHGNFPGKYAFESAFYIPVHIVFAIWGIPCWIFVNLGLAEVTSTGCLLWAKLLIVLSYAGCIYITNKLLKKQDCENNDFWIFTLASSVMLFLSPFAMATYDTFQLFLILLTIYYASNEDNLSFKTLIIMSAAVSFKFLMFFTAMTIILLKEKRILKILKSTIIMMIIPGALYIFSQLFRRTAIGSNPEELTVGFAHRFFSVILNGGLFNISIYFIFIFAILLYAYLSNKNTSSENFIKSISWLTTAQFLALFLFVYKNEPQWIVFLPPFIILTIFNNHKRFESNIILENILEICITIVQIFYFGWQYMSEELFDFLLFKNIPTTFLLRKDIANGYIILANLGLESYMPVFCALILCIGTALLITNLPKQKQEATTIINEKPIIITSNILRLIILALYFIVIVLIRFFI